MCNDSKNFYTLLHKSQNPFLKCEKEALKNCHSLESKCQINLKTKLKLDSFYLCHISLVQNERQCKIIIIIIVEKYCFISSDKTDSGKQN